MVWTSVLFYFFPSSYLPLFKIKYLFYHGIYHSHVQVVLGYILHKSKNDSVMINHYTPSPAPFTVIGQMDSLAIGSPERPSFLLVYKIQII